MLDPDRIYLNTGSFGSKPRRVFDRLLEGLRTIEADLGQRFATQPFVADAPEVTGWSAQIYEAERTVDGVGG